MQTRVSKIFIVALVIVLGMLTSARVAHAGLAVSPLKQEVTLRPGEEGKVILNISNRARPGAPVIPESATLTIRDVGVLIGGELEFRDPGTQHNSASAWTILSTKQLSLEGGKSQAVELTIKPPLQTKPGEYYTAVIITLAKHGHSDKGVDIIYEVASGVFVNVSGENYPKQAKITNCEIMWPTSPVAATQPATQPAPAEETDPINVAVILQNTGLARFSASGKLRIIDLATNRVVMTSIITNPRPCVFGGDSRLFKTPITKSLPAGSYAIKIDMDYQSNWAKANFTQNIEITPEQAALLSQLETRQANTTAGVTIISPKLTQSIPPGGSRSLGVGIKSASDVPVRCMLSSAFTGDTDIDSWITISMDDFLLAPSSHQSVEVKLTVPLDTKPGTYTATLAIETWPEGSDVRRTELPVEIQVLQGRN